MLCGNASLGVQRQGAAVRPKFFRHEFPTHHRQAPLEKEVRDICKIKILHFFKLRHDVAVPSCLYNCALFKFVVAM